MSLSSDTGLISAIAFSPSYDFYAAGSLVPSMPNIALFSESEGETPVMFVGRELDVTAGVTQVCHLAVSIIVNNLTHSLAPF